MKHPRYLTALLLIACSHCPLFAEGLAPVSINGLTLRYTVLGGNSLRVSPSVNWILGTSGAGNAAYTEAGFAEVGPTGLIQGSYGSYTYAASGDSATQTQISQAPGIPTVPLLSLITFTGPLAGTWIQTWGEASNHGTFVVTPTTPLVPLVNIATRIDLVPGQTVTPGFVVGGPIVRKVLVRAVGPGLAPFGVSAAIPATRLSVFSGSTVLATNAGWTSAPGGEATLQATFASVGAFGLPVGSADSALLLTLPPGNYTASAGGAGAGDRGTILVEVYFVP